MRSYALGTVVRITGTFRNASGEPTDPTARTLRVQAPDGTVTSHTDATSSATGVWIKDITPTQEGTYQYRWTGTGAVAAEDENSFRIRQRRVPNS